jgi:polyphosphate glucokinase
MNQATTGLSTVRDVTLTSSDDTSEHPFTLSIDVGGTGLKASVLSKTGAMVADRVRVDTKYPLPPEGEGGLVDALVALVKPLPAADRISCGFPGMVRNGIVLTAPHFVCKKGPGSQEDKKLSEAWDHFDLATALSTALAKPTKVANDADVQGAAVVIGKGLELVITLGTGMGSAFFMDGQLMPHLELGHHPFRKDETYDENLGELARKNKGDESWNRRVREAIGRFQALFFYDHLYIGGGNARRVDRDELGDALENITIVDNAAGILGGIKLWEVS